MRREKLARDDQAFAGHDHPAAVLAADGVDPAEAGHGIAGIDLEDSRPAFDQRAATGNIAQHPAFHRRQSAYFGLGRGRRGIYEVYAGDFVPGLGRVDAIRRQDGRWVVVTSKGLIVAR